MGSFRPAAGNRHLYRYYNFTESIAVSYTHLHTLLKPDATREEILKLCRDAAQYDFASVCVNAVSYTHLLHHRSGAAANNLPANTCL